MFYTELSAKEDVKITEVIDKDSELHEKVLLHMKEWLKKQPHLPQNIGDAFLLNFLRCRKYSLEETKQKFDKYYTYRNILAEYYSNLDPLLPEMKHSMDHQVVSVCPGYTPEGYRFGVGCFEGVDTETFRIDILAKRCILNFELLTQVDSKMKGQVVFADISDMKLGHVLRFPITDIRKVVIAFQDAYPHRLKHVFVYGLNPLTMKLVNVFLQFASEKMKKRVTFLDENNFHQLFDVVPRKMVPDEYGGSAGSKFDLNQRWNKELLKRREWLVEMCMRKTDESKRIGKPKIANELLGMEGSFRQLTFD